MKLNLRKLAFNFILFVILVAFWLLLYAALRGACA